MSIGFLGGGKMAEAIIAGLRKDNPDEAILVYDIDRKRLTELAQRFGVRALSGPQELFRPEVDLILAVKPQVLPELLGEVGADLPAGQLVMSIAAGLSLGQIRQWIPQCQLIRVMPNTPGLIGQGVSCLWGDQLTVQEKERGETIFQSIGTVHWVEERYFDGVTGVSGSGPAYVYHFIEALENAGVNEGLPRSLARELAVDTVVGSALMVRETGSHPGELKNMVTSPGGTTIRALEALEENGFANAVYKAVGAAAKRSKELGS